MSVSSSQPFCRVSAHISVCSFRHPPSTFVPCPCLCAPSFFIDLQRPPLLHHPSRQQPSSASFPSSVSPHRNTSKKAPIDVDQLMVDGNTSRELGTITSYGLLADGEANSFGTGERSCYWVRGRRRMWVRMWVRMGSLRR